MILLVGLGNPGPRYAATRHNVGFRVVDQFAERHGAPGFRSRFEGESTQIDFAGTRVAILKPMTFMNRSGHSVRAAMAFYKLEASEILIVHDELDLATGDLRLKVGGGEAGHNGLRSISEQLGSRDYARLRCGIGRGPGYTGTTVDYVLDAFFPDELPQILQLLDRAVEAIDHVIESGLANAMNVTNRKLKT